MNNIKWITLQANWVGYYKDIVSNELCDKIIDYSNNIKQLENRIEMDDGWFRNGEQYYNEIKDCFMVALKKYQEQHQNLIPLRVLREGTHLELSLIFLKKEKGQWRWPSSYPLKKHRENGCDHLPIP